MNDKIDTIVAGVNRKDEKMWGDFYDRFYTALMCLCFQDIASPRCGRRFGTRSFYFCMGREAYLFRYKELTNYLYRACYNNALLYIRNNQIHDTIF